MYLPCHAVSNAQAVPPESPLASAVRPASRHPVHVASCIHHPSAVRSHAPGSTVHALQCDCSSVKECVQIGARWRPPQAGDPACQRRRANFQERRAGALSRGARVRAWLTGSRERRAVRAANWACSGVHGHVCRQPVGVRGGREGKGPSGTTRGAGACAEGGVAHAAPYWRRRARVRAAFVKTFAL